MKRSVEMRIGGIALLLAGLAVLALALARGEAEVVLVLIIPIIYSGGVLGPLGILLIFSGFALLSFSFFADLPSSEDGEQEEEHIVKKEYGGVVLIGPIPIVFGSARSLKGSRLLWIAAALSFLAVVLYLVLIL